MNPELMLTIVIRWSHLRKSQCSFHTINRNVDLFTFLENSILPEPSEPFLRMQNSISPFLRILIGCAIGASFLQSDMSASTYRLFVFIRDSSLPHRRHSDFSANYSTIGRVVISFPLELELSATEIRYPRRIQVCISNLFLTEVLTTRTHQTVSRSLDTFVLIPYEAFPTPSLNAVEAFFRTCFRSSSWGSFFNFSTGLQG